MNTNTLDAPVAAPSVWLGPDMARNPATWIYQLSNAELQEIAAAVSHARSIGLSIPTLAAEGFPLPHLAPKLRELLYEVQFGRGFVLIRGMGALNYGEEDLSLAYWGLGAYFGKPATQNAKGDVLGHVRDEGRKFGELDARGYHSN
ncbi:MAG TPA: TauD/TfdA family dioxygenase, partial [Bordetella sp.]